MKIAIITAMPEEFRAVTVALGGDVAATRLGILRAGRFTDAGHEYLLVESGVGLDNAAMAAELIVGDGRPDLLITTGFCGGIAPELRAGDIVVAHGIVIAREGYFDEIPAPFSGIGRTFVAGEAAAGKRVGGGTFVTTATITSKAQLGRMLPEQYPCPVVEMESGSIALVAAAHDIPLLAIRAVSDISTEELDFSLDEFCDAEMRRILIPRVLLTVLRKPYIIPQLIRLAFSSRTAEQSLAAVLSRLFPAL